jgi:hypothetical protein
MENKSITGLLYELVENICENFCKYRDTCDEDAQCEVIRDGQNCPLDLLV